MGSPMGTVVRLVLVGARLAEDAAIDTSRAGRADYRSLWGHSNIPYSHPTSPHLRAHHAIGMKSS
jgi:hypothetical protein